MRQNGRKLVENHGWKKSGQTREQTVTGNRYFSNNFYLLSFLDIEFIIELEKEVKATPQYCQNADLFDPLTLNHGSSISIRSTKLRACRSVMIFRLFFLTKSLRKCTLSLEECFFCRILFISSSSSQQLWTEIVLWLLFIYSSFLIQSGLRGRIGQT